MNVMVTERALVPLDDILPNPYQPDSRVQVDMITAKKFADSILEHGLLQTPVCRWGADNKLEMGDGWLRLCGYKWLRDNGHPEFSELPVMVRELTNRQMADLVMEANTVRQDLTPIELARFYKKYLGDFKITQADLAKSHNVSQGEIANTIRLLELPDEIQKKIISREISETHGRCLLQVADKPEVLKTLVSEIIEKGLTVSALDAMVKMYSVKTEPKAEKQKTLEGLQEKESEPNNIIEEPENSAKQPQTEQPKTETPKKAKKLPLRKVALTETTDAVLVAIVHGTAPPFIKKVPGKLENAVPVLFALLNEADSKFKEVN